MEIVQRKVYAVPAVPLKVDVGEEGVPNDPPEPLTTDQAPVPIEAVLAAKVTDVNPQVAAPVWSGPALAAGAGFWLNVILTVEFEVQFTFVIVHLS